MPGTDTPPRAAGDSIRGSRLLSVTLLDDLVAGALDPGYAHAARHRPDHGRSHGWSQVAAAVALLVVGLATGVALGGVSRSRPAQAATQRALVAQTSARLAQLRALTAQVGASRLQVNRLRQAELATTAAGQRLDAEITRLESASGLLAAAGAGVLITLTDGPLPHAPGAALPTDELVSDADLQQVVNQLLALGARAVAINGVRIGPVSAIRAAGQAVLVGFQPVGSPFVVAAVGPPNRLLTGFAASATAQELRTVAAVYGIGIQEAAAPRLTLPPAGEPDLLEAVPIGGSGP